MKSIVVANWKMNPTTFKDAKKLLDVTKKAAEAAKGVSVIVAPPSIYLRELRSIYKGKRLAFAAQNAHFEKSGSFTGDISLLHVRDSKVTHILIGHAERRAQGETNEDVKKKLLFALDLKMTPVLCVGETKRTQEGEHYTFVRSQLTSVLREVAPAKVPQILIAYEPVWAIGKDKPMNPREMHEMAIFIRKVIVEMHGQGAMNMKILYGGAIDETNAGLMLREGDVNGLLVGRASADPVRFPALLEAVASI